MSGTVPSHAPRGHGFDSRSVIFPPPGFDRPGAEPMSSGCIVWEQYHSSEKVSCDEWYWNPSPNISGYMCARAPQQRRRTTDRCQRMNVAGKRNGKRTTGGGGATHTKGRTKADHHTEGRTKRPTGGRRGTHTGNTQTICMERGTSYAACCSQQLRRVL